MSAGERATKGVARLFSRAGRSKKKATSSAAQRKAALQRKARETLKRQQAARDKRRG